MANCLWTFETPTTTGLEGDLDTLSGLAMLPRGDGSTGPNPGPIPCPTVPGHTGNGRLLASANKFNIFGTIKNTTIIHTGGQPMALNFWWRPLVDYAGGLAGSHMLYFAYIGYSVGGTVGNTYIEVQVTSDVVAGLYNFRVNLQGFYVPITTFDFLDIPLTLRDWNEIEINYDGANTLNLEVNGAVVGTITPTDLVMPTTDHGELRFAKLFAGSGALYGVLDTVSLTIS